MRPAWPGGSGWTAPSRWLTTAGLRGPQKICISQTLLAILYTIDFGLPLEQALSQPRFHHQWKPDQLIMEPGFSPDTLALLRSRGHRIDVSPGIGQTAAVLCDGEWLQGAADSRAEGRARGY